ncbi:MAG: hypothetical protein ACPIOQ_41620, partial [Promethearchaeia archaeon]
VAAAASSQQRYAEHSKSVSGAHAGGRRLQSAFTLPMRLQNGANPRTPAVGIHIVEKGGTTRESGRTPH